MPTLMHGLHVLLLAGICAQYTLAGLSCRDSTNKVQDWVFAYKQPNGFAYAYKDSSDTRITPLLISPYSLNSSSNFAWSTLHPVYENKKGLAYAFYNDEAPTGSVTSSGAHAKGVIATDGESGFWLVHSVPKYPDLTASTFTWTASDIYGQSFLCISMGAKDLDAMAKQVILMQPQVFASNMPSTLASKYPNLATLAAGKVPIHMGDSSIVDFKSSGGRSFRSFAKDPSWDKDLYADLVQPNLKINMLVETWRRAPFLPSYCAGSGGREYNTLNVDTIVFPTNNFKYTQDHSKWGISADEKSPYVCVGGINRMQSQRNRGGGTVCTSDSLMWSAIHGVIGTTDSCKPGSPTPAPPGPAPKPTPKPAPGPSPTGACCYESATSCSKGQVCCKSNCKDPKTCSYTKTGCDGSYGKKHHCEWTGSECVVGSASASFTASVIKQL